MGNEVMDYSTKALLSRIHTSLKAVQGLMPTSPEDRERLKDSIRKQGIRDPLKVIYSEEDGKPYLISGWTRLLIAEELGIDKVPILPVTTKDPEGYAISENLDRRQMTLEQKRNLAEYLIRKNPEKSDRQVGKEAGIDHKTVSKIRENPRGEIPHVSQAKGGKPKTEPVKRDTLGRRVGEKPTAVGNVKKLKDQISELKKQKAQIEIQIRKLEDQLKKASK